VVARANKDELQFRLTALCSRIRVSNPRDPPSGVRQVTKRTSHWSDCCLCCGRGS
jgi:hypothetical protein